MSDYAIGALVRPDAIAVALAHAFNVSPSQVTVMPHDLFTRPDDIWPDAEFVIDVNNDDPSPGDYPLSVSVWGADDREPEASSLAVELGVPILIGADVEEYDGFELHLPDGSRHLVSVEQDDDGGIRNTPEMRRLIASATATAQAARAA